MLWFREQFALVFVRLKAYLMIDQGIFKQKKALGLPALVSVMHLLECHAACD